MNGIDLTPNEIEQLTAAIRKGATAIVEAWAVLISVGERIKHDWEPGDGAVRDIMDTFASKMRTAEDITPAAVQEAFGRREDWKQIS
jgi:hypothetical protein